MLLNTLTSSLFISYQTGFSKLFLYTSQLSSLQLSNRNIKHLSKSLDLQPILSSKYFIRPSLPLALLDNFPDVFLKSEDIDKKKDQFDNEKEELIAKAAINKVFLERNLAFDSDSKFESIHDFNLNKSESDDSTSF